MKPPTGMANRLGSLARLFGIVLVAAGGGSAAAQTELLPPEETFRPTAEALGPDRVRITWEVAKGYYLFRDTLELKVVEPAGVGVAAIEKPPGMPKYDPSLRKRRRIYRGDAWLVAELEGNEGADAVTVSVRYQGSAAALDAGICFPVQSTEFDVSLK